MTFVKSLWIDLVEKRLWPVAVVLLLALVAVPVALGGGSDAAPPAAPLGATGATGAAAQTAQVALDPAVLGRGDRGGKVRDPFKQRALPAEGPAGASGATGPGGPAVPASKVTPPAAGGGDPAPQGPSGPTGPSTPPQTAPPTPDPPDSYVVTLRFGKAGAKRPRREVERLTPLPSPESPFFVYLGVLSHAKTAVFMLSSDVEATGDGTCKPRKSSCETVELRRGDSELLDVTDEDGKVTKYRLDLVRITKQPSAAPSRAVAARKRVTAKSATKVSRDEELSSERYTYDDETGMLHRAKSAADLGGHLPSAGDEPRAALREVAAAQASTAFPTFLPGP